MESLIFRRLIFIFIITFFFIVCNTVWVHGFDIYLSHDSSATSQSGSSPDNPSSSAIYFSYDSESDFIASYGATDNQRSLQSISSAISATTENIDGISDTQISKSLIHSVLKANRDAAGTANRPGLKSKAAGAGGTANRPVQKAKTAAAAGKSKTGGGGTANRPVLKSKTAGRGGAANRPVPKAKPAGGGGANPELRKICSKTENPSLCVSTVAPRLRGGGANPRAVLDISIKASYDLAKAGAAKVKKLRIKECKGSFSDALSNFDQALKAFQKKDVGTMNSMLSAVVTDMSDCQDKLSGSGSPLIALGDKLATMTSNCLLIIPQMH